MPKRHCKFNMSKIKPQMSPSGHNCSSSNLPSLSQWTSHSSSCSDSFYPDWPPHYPSNRPSVHLSQGLCTCRSFHLDHCSSRSYVIPALTLAWGSNVVLSTKLSDHSAENYCPHHHSPLPSLNFSIQYF